MLAIGLLLGGFALSRVASAFAALAVGLLGGLALGHLGGAPTPLLYGLACATAATAALAPGLWREAAIVAAGAVGVGLGWASVPEAGPEQDRVLTMAGSVAGVVLMTLYLAGAIDLLSERVDRPEVRIALRVAAAWVAAVAILLFALAVSPAQPKV